MRTRYPPPTAETAAGRGMNGVNEPNLRRQTNSRYGGASPAPLSRPRGALPDFRVLVPAPPLLRSLSHEILVEDRSAQVDAVGVRHELAHECPRHAGGSVSHGPPAA